MRVKFPVFPGTGKMDWPISIFWLRPGFAAANIEVDKEESLSFCFQSDLLSWWSIFSIFHKCIVPSDL